MYLAIVTKYRMLASHPIWPFWKRPFAFFKECESIVVKPRITTSSGDVQQSIVVLTKGMSPVPLQHLTVSPPQHGCDQKKANPEDTDVFYIFKALLLLRSIFAAQSL